MVFPVTIICNNNKRGIIFLLGSSWRIWCIDSPIELSCVSGRWGLWSQGCGAEAVGKVLMFLTVTDPLELFL